MLKMILCMVERELNKCFKVLKPKMSASKCFLFAFPLKMYFIFAVSFFMHFKRVLLNDC